MSFIFDRNFDAEAEAQRRGDQAKVGAIYTRAEFDAAVAKAQAEGFEAGLAQGRDEASSAAQQSTSARQVTAVEAIGPALQALFTDADHHHAVLESQMVGFALSVLRQVAPAAGAALAEQEALQEARGAVRMALGAAELKFHFAPEVTESSAAEIQRVARHAGFGGRIEVKPDPALATGDVRAEWDHGVMHYSFNDICQRILGALEDSKARIDTSVGQDQAGE
ncbi:hypothetical protein CLG85_003750 [Yangia mangrovi]|uniref:Flagellar assembly protein FliH/Type III secretion system HrpE domain-containing protein n=3 Tax=Alloyangia mangrovi TaxID=1779329 RepID=A0ABT2KGK7_9RHOB|nr:FliH/SctL family protein [Alloyangia mangrovi]MCT4369504.1 hypothetical protein [Alloyangia mangrovi]